MLYLAIIYHMHQPYYKDLLTGEFCLPWVRLHGIKDYLDMVELLKDFPKIHLTFNLVPSLIEQLEDYLSGNVQDKFLNLSYKRAEDLSQDEKNFILKYFFMADVERIISLHPRYYELYLKRQNNGSFNTQDYLDLQVWFNLAWFDPTYRKNIPELKNLVIKGRFFNEEEKKIALDKQKDILSKVMPAYKSFQDQGQIEVSISPYYHPILPLIYNLKLALEARPKTPIPKDTIFSYPEDVTWHVKEAVQLYSERFGKAPLGMWPSEESVCEHILPDIYEAGINWIVTDEAILFKSLKKKRKPDLLYQAHSLKRKEGSLNIIFRDANLSNLIGFVYHHWKTEDSVNNFMGHLQNIANYFKDRDCLVTIALDGENPWEYYKNDGIDFLNLLYTRLSDEPGIKTVTVSEYLKLVPTTNNIERLAAGSWIYGDFCKWIGNPEKNLAWEFLAKAREKLRQLTTNSEQLTENEKKAYKQIYIAEGSDWFWWFGDNEADFDALFRQHLANFYTLLAKEIPTYLKVPLRETLGTLNNSR